MVCRPDRSPAQWRDLLFLEAATSFTGKLHLLLTLSGLGRYAANSQQEKRRRLNSRRLRSSGDQQTNFLRSVSDAPPIASSLRRQCASGPRDSICVCEVLLQASRKQYSCCLWG